MSAAILPTLQFLMQQNTMQKVLLFLSFDFKMKNFWHINNPLFWQEVLSRLISSIEETSGIYEYSSLF